MDSPQRRLRGKPVEPVAGGERGAGEAAESEPMTKLRSMWAMNPMKDLWPKVPPKTTRPKYRREDRPFLYKAGLLAIPI